MLHKVKWLSISLLCLFFWSCDEPKSDKIYTTFNSGEVTIYCDQTMEPVMSAQLEVFLHSNPKAKVNMVYASENEVVRALISGVAKMGIMGRELNADEKKAIEPLTIVPRHLADVRQVHIVVAVKIPVFGARRVGVVRVGEGGHHAKGLAGIKSCVIIDLAHGKEGHFVIVLKLIGDFGNAGLQHAGHIVVPPINALLLQAPIRRPAEISWVNIGGQAFFKAMQLVGANEMHLAGEAGLVALQTEIMGPCWDGRWKLRCVVIDARARGQQPVHYGGAGWRAKRAGRVTTNIINRFHLVVSSWASRMRVTTSSKQPTCQFAGRNMLFRNSFYGRRETTNS